jgi:CheY-like chemotaxis protein
MNNPYILIIEDNKAINEALTWALEIEGYNVKFLNDGEEALAYLNHNALPKMIFLDLMMPNFDGYEFRAAQKADPRLKTIPTIITSAKMNFQETLNAPSEIFLSKPFELEDFFTMVQKYYF